MLECSISEEDIRFKVHVFQDPYLNKITYRFQDVISTTFQRCSNVRCPLGNHQLKAKKRKNNNEGFNNMHIILLMHVYALAKIRPVKLKRPVEKYAWYDTGSRHASRRHRVPQCDLCLPMCDWALPRGHLTLEQR